MADEEEKKSEFNEASFKMMRLHKLQEEINLARQNPFGMELRMGMPNYLVWISNLNSLYYESLGKGKKKDLEEITKVKNLLNEQKKIPIIIKNKTSLKNTIHNKNWDRLEKSIEFYESLIRQLMEKVGLSGRDAMGAGLF